MSRVLLDRDFIEEDLSYQFGRSPFAAKWIGPAEIPVDNGFFAFRRQVDGAAGRLRLHVSADQRYILYLNGVRIGRGSERGDLRHWMYETYDIDLPGGKNTLVAIVWFLSPTGKTPPPWSQVTQRPGFWLQAQGDGASDWHTGAATDLQGWHVKQVPGLAVDTHQFVHFPGHAVGPRIVKDGRRYAWGIEAGAGDDWMAPAVLQEAMTAHIVREGRPYWLLQPAMLPGMKDELVTGWTVRHVDQPRQPDTIDFPIKQSSAPASWEAPQHVPPQSLRRFILDLHIYSCAYSRLVVSGGCDATIRIRWAESLFEPGPDFDPDKPVRRQDATAKGDRGEIDGRLFFGTGDRFIANGTAQQIFEPLWWNAGRYIEIVIETAAEALTIESLELRATGYPYQYESTFAASDPRLAEVQTLALHTMDMCSHETSMDCPYYEQLNYTGDTRLQSLVAMATSRDDRLVRKGLKLFDWSRTGDTWTSSRWPTSITQTIPPFAMWWACMAHDYALWRGDLPFVQTLMPGVRSILERWREQIAPDGLLRQPAGWNFVDWVMRWPGGVPNLDIGSPCGVLQWQLVYTLMKAADLEEWIGEPLLAQRNRQTAAALAASAERAFFDTGRQLLASDLAHSNFSEHAQVLAILSGQLSANLRDAVAAGITGVQPIGQSSAQQGAQSIDTATLYFRHYSFEALTDLGRTDLILQRMDTWFDHKGLGLTTGLEQPEPSRSDCHAWSAHPAYHFYASLLGIRPATVGFERVRIAPRLGPLEWAKGQMVHPRGTIRVDLRQQAGRLSGTIELPAGLAGDLILPDGSRPLAGGVMNI